MDSVSCCSAPLSADRRTDLEAHRPLTIPRLLSCLHSITARTTGSRIPLSAPSASLLQHTASGRTALTERYAPRRKLSDPTSSLDTDTHTLPRRASHHTQQWRHNAPTKPIPSMKVSCRPQQSFKGEVGANEQADIFPGFHTALQHLDSMWTQHSGQGSSRKASSRSRSLEFKQSSRSVLLVRLGPIQSISTILLRCLVQIARFDCDARLFRPTED